MTEASRSRSAEAAKAATRFAPHGMVPGSLGGEGGALRLPPQKPSVREWLDKVRDGYAGKFALAFEELGIEEQADLANIAPSLADQIFARVTACGAKELHKSLLVKALTAAGATLGAAHLGNAGSPRRRLSRDIATEAAPDDVAGAPSMVTAHPAPLERAKSRPVPLDRSRSSSKDASSWRSTGKRFAAFISHHKRDSAMEARFLHEHLEAELDATVFLDSEDLQDLRDVLDHVRDSEVLLLVQTTEVLLRPWCILEIHTALSAGIPIVAVALRGKKYDLCARRLEPRSFAALPLCC